MRGGQDRSSDPDEFQGREGNPGEPGSGDSTGRGRDSPELLGTGPWSARKAATHRVLHGPARGPRTATAHRERGPHVSVLQKHPGRERPPPSETRHRSPGHSLGDHGNLDPEDARLFSGRHPLQAELPAGELD